MSAILETRHASGVDLAMPRVLLGSGAVVARLQRSDGNRTLIGRHPPAYICLADDPYISAVHACITWVNAFQAHVLHDCGSSNGTFLDGVRVTRPMRLINDARIRIGLTDLVYCNKQFMRGYIPAHASGIDSPHELETPP